MKIPNFYYSSYVSNLSNIHLLKLYCTLVLWYGILHLCTSFIYEEKCKGNDKDESKVKNGKKKTSVGLRNQT